MEQTVKIIPEGYMQDRKGRLVPKSIVSDYDLEMDAFVKSQITKAKNLQSQLREFKKQAFGDCYAWMDLVAEKYDRQHGGLKGNVTFSTFDGSQQIRISVQDYMDFGPELQIAKDIIDELIAEWSVGANENLLAISADTFDVDKEGKLSTGRILSLRRHKITDPRWLRAMEAIAESLQVAVSKTYINFREKGPDGKLNNIPLDLAAL